MRDDSSRAALAQELTALKSGVELRLSYEDFEVLFPPQDYGGLSGIESPGNWCFELAKAHGCGVRDDKAAGSIVFWKAPMRTGDQ
jgi:hypothetical protein